MYLFSVCLTIPISVATSILALVPPIRRVFRRSVIARIVLLTIWGLTIFLFATAFTMLSAAIDVYNFSTGEYSALPSSMIADVEANREVILVEFGLRTLLWDGYVGNDCYTDPHTCALADMMDRHLGAEVWWGGATDIVLLAGGIPAITSVVSVGGLLLLFAGTSKPDSQPEGISQLSSSN